MPALKSEKRFEGKRLRAVLKDLGWTATTFAEKEGLNINAVYSVLYRGTHGRIGECAKVCEIVEKYENRIRDARRNNAVTQACVGAGK